MKSYDLICRSFTGSRAGEMTNRELRNCHGIFFDGLAGLRRKSEERFALLKIKNLSLDPP